MKTSHLNRVVEDATDVAEIAEMVINSNHPDFIKAQAEKIIAIGKRMVATVDQNSIDQASALKAMIANHEELN